MIRIGIVGCGHIATVHSYALRRLSDAGLVDARVTATFDCDRERAATIAGHHDAEAMPSLEALLDDVEVVWICTWTAAHLEAVEAAAGRGCAVFCEKPLAPSFSLAEQLTAELERVPHQVGLVLRHAPVFQAVAEIVQSGRYGRPLATVLRDDQYFPIQGMYASTWRSDPGIAGGGTLIEHSIHDVDLLRWILGDPIEVSARTACLFGHEGVDDVATLTLRYGSGSAATIVSVWHQILTRGSSRRLEVFCEEALLWTDDDHLGPLHVETSTGEELVVPPPPEWIDRLSLPEVLAKPLAQYAAPSKRFLDALARDGREARGHPDARIALAAHALVDLAYRSAADGGVSLKVPA
jgi:UDP-N-acetyl-2-amino-2-deoxyglucuronate dehydrogenase